MSLVGARVLLIASLGSLACLGQSSSTSATTSQVSEQSQQSAPLPPSPPDMPMPDPATFPKHDDKAKSSPKRVLERLTPLCLDWAFHTCWFTGSGDVPQTDEADREFAKNFSVGDAYFKGKNYRGAESRFREALEYKPNHPEATYKLAVSVDKLGKTDEAQALYEAYLSLSPTGPYADRARKALRKKSASTTR